VTQARPLLVVLLITACRPWLDGPCGGDNTAQKTFDTFWACFDLNYAVFEERLEGDWEQLGTQQCDALTSQTTEEELFTAVLTLARHLDDGHTTLHAKDLGRREDAWVSVYPHYPQVYALERLVERTYLDGSLAWAAEDWVAWGRADDIGYLSLTSMDGLSSKGTLRADIEATHLAMERVLRDLGDTRAMVVDARANEGGWDEVSLAFAEYFAGPRALAWSEERRDGPAHHDLRKTHSTFVAASSGYDAPVVLLTSGGTFSAGESFVLAMRTRPAVTVLGEPTSGHLSDMIDGRLPNGWTYTFSGERYTAADGEVYEGRGIPVDVAVDLDPGAVDAGYDVMFEAALALLR
jgi:carboxyl-terminal processing protease